MKVLKQLHHGLPGLGNIGKLGKLGEQANSIYMGFINEFFDGSEISIGAYVYLAKRLLRPNDFGKKTTNAAREITLAEIAKNVTPNSNASLYLNTYINDISNGDASYQYINFKDFFYTGITANNEILDNIGFNSSIINDAIEVNLDLNGDFLQMAFMLSTAENSSSNINPSTYKTELDTKISQSMKDAYGDMLNDMYSIDFNDGVPLLTDTGNSIYLLAPDISVYIPLDTIDYVYKDSVEETLAGDVDYGTMMVLNPNTFMLGLETSRYLDSSKLYVIENTILNNTDFVLDVNTIAVTLKQEQSGERITKYGLSNNENDKLLLKSQWNILYKTTETRKKTENTGSDILLDSNDNQFIGVKMPDLFDYQLALGITSRQEIIDVDVKNATGISLDYLNLYNNAKENNYGVGILSTTDGLKVLYSIANSDTLFVPTKLKSKYKVGDVLYFFTNSQNFYNDDAENANNYLLKYMVVLTEELLECTPSQLIASALLVDPLKGLIFVNKNGRLQNYNQIAVLTNFKLPTNSSALNFANKSFIGIASNYTQAPVLLSGKNTGCFNNFVAIENSSIYNSVLSGSLDDNFIINSSLPIKINSLYVTNNISNETNIELSKKVYDKNIKFYSNNFIKPLLSTKLMYTKTDGNISFFRSTVRAYDYFYNLKKLDDYFYGCDIYNRKMELIKTYSSNKPTLNIDIIPTISDTEFYIQMFASCGSSVKYYSKMSKLTVKFGVVIEDNIKNVRSPYGYNNSFGVFSKVIKKSKMSLSEYRTKYERVYDKNIGIYYNKPVGVYMVQYKINSYDLSILGDNVQITKKKNLGNGNIFLDMSAISAEKVENASLRICLKNDDIQIKHILFNHSSKDVFNDKSHWAYINNVSDGFILSCSSNLPVYNGIVSDTIKDFVITGCSSTNSTNGDSLLFYDLKNGSTYSTDPRSILLTVGYTKGDDNEIYYENFDIVQPGFNDTRNVPNIELKVNNSMRQLLTYNNLDCGTLVNQFIEYMDINVKDFKKYWGKYSKDASIFLSFDIKNIDYDLNWQDRYVVSDLIPRKTFRTVLGPEVTSKQININNYVKIKSELIDTFGNNIIKNINKIPGDTSNALRCGGSFEINLNFILTDEYYNNWNPSIFDDLVLCDSSFVSTCGKPELIYTGLLDNIELKFKDIPMSDNISNLKLRLLLEIGNPLVSNLYFRFAVTNVSIKVVRNNTVKAIFESKIPDNIINTFNTYLGKYNRDIDNEKTVSTLSYKFISDPIDITINPISYVVCPEKYELSYTNFHGNHFIYGIKEQIKKEVNFYNASLYENNQFDFSSVDIRELFYYPFDNLYIKKSYIQDNIKSICINPIPLCDISTNSSTLIIDSSLKSNFVKPEFLGRDKYLSIAYHATLMLPKLENTDYVFYYNDNKYLRSKYNLKVNNCPIYAYDENIIPLRDDDIINSMNKWNLYYTKNSYDDAQTYDGILSMYGNGYTQILQSTIDSLVPSDASQLNNIINVNSEIINNIDVYNEVDIYPSLENQPNNKEYFRGFLYDINFEYPYYENNEIIPYRILTPFDNFIINTSTAFEPIENTDDEEEPILQNTYYFDYYNTLVNSSLYGSRMIPYTLLYDINPRIAYNYETGGINVLMLRKPSIGKDEEYMSNNDPNKLYRFKRQLFDPESFIELESPYLVD